MLGVHKSMEPTAERLFTGCSRLSAAAHLNRYTATMLDDGVLKEGLLVIQFSIHVVKLI